MRQNRAASPSDELQWRIAQANEKAAEANARAAEALKDLAALRLELEKRLTRVETEQLAQHKVDQAHEKRFERLENRLISAAIAVGLLAVKVGFDLLKNG